MDTQNHGFENVTPFQMMAIFGIYVGFLGCKELIRQLECFSKSILLLTPKLGNMFNEEIFTKKTNVEVYTWRFWSCFTLAVKTSFFY